ncbi:MAG: hypothetical protein CVV25_03975 [Ignavibacteriae bacterium HGW-Ignavibacteriae-4]|jgi:hypothetical protein|nr:MAG: hypothetical protein CVV25_03975 [Ignavibacteriae bacterium HGW-Ignavibacteriae-4]
MDKLQLSYELTKFYIDNLHFKNINEWDDEINSINAIEQLEVIKDSFIFIQRKLPDEFQIDLYSTEGKFQLTGYDKPFDIPGGDQKIINDIDKKGKIIIQIIDRRISELKESEVKHFDKFGVWDDNAAPAYFILFPNTLPCVVVAFTQIKKIYRFSYEEQFDMFSDLLYKKKDTPYKRNGIRSAWQHRKHTSIDCKKDKAFSLAESTEFLEYLIEFSKK